MSEAVERVWCCPVHKCVLTDQFDGVLYCKECDDWVALPVMLTTVYAAKKQAQIARGRKLAAARRKGDHANSDV